VFSSRSASRGLPDYDVRVAAAQATNLRVIGRYAIFDEIASGGMAAVHVGRLLGPAGFSRTVAIKRLHPQFARDPEFLTMFLDEARLAARIRHPNVVPTLDVVSAQGEIFLVMEYFLGESFAKLLGLAKQAGGRPPIDVTAAIVAAALHGLHAAHEAKDERGEPLGIVHRDVSPQNILVGADGIARVLDFGIAKAEGRAQVTREGQVRGKMAYVAPEQFLVGRADRKADVYAASVVLWEALTGQRLFLGETEAQTVARVLNDTPVPPSSIVPGISPELDRLVLRGLSRNPEDRPATARDMARDLEAIEPPSAPSKVAEWVESMLGPELAERARVVSKIEQLRDLPATGLSSHPPRLLATAEEPTAVEYRSSVNASPGRVETTGSLEPTLVEFARKRRQNVVLVIAGIALILLAFLLLFGRLPDLSPALPSEPSGAKLVPSAPPLVDVPPDVPAAAPVLAPLVPTVSAAPAPGASASAPPRSPPARTRARSKDRGKCDPPYTIDGAGVRRYKMECL
jgi:eukaryotic-like serine/threonine-protein kinase